MLIMIKFFFGAFNVFNGDVLKDVLMLYNLIDENTLEAIFLYCDLFIEY